MREPDSAPPAHIAADASWPPGWFTTAAEVGVGHLLASERDSMASYDDLDAPVGLTALR